MMKKPSVILSALLIALAVLIYALWSDDAAEDTENGALIVYCAAALQKPVREIADCYEQETGVKIRLRFAGSGVLESQIKVAGGDLYLPADSSYIVRMVDEGWVKECIPLTELRVCIVVQKGNPENIQSLNDLTRSGLRISSADTSAAVGQFAMELLTKSGAWSKISPQVLVYKPTVNNVVEDVAMRAVDAGLAWDAVALQSPHVEIVRVPLFENHPSQAMVGVVRGAKAALVLHFARYLAADGRGRGIFSKYQFAVPAGSDRWADSPELEIFSTSGLTPSLRQRISAFEKREGCRIKLVLENDAAGTHRGVITAGDSDYPLMMLRLRDFLSSADTGEHYRYVGFD